MAFQEQLQEKVKLTKIAYGKRLRQLTKTAALLCAGIVQKLEFKQEVAQHPINISRWSELSQSCHCHMLS